MLLTTAAPQVCSCLPLFARWRCIAHACCLPRSRLIQVTNILGHSPDCWLAGAGWSSPFTYSASLPRTLLSLPPQQLRPGCQCTRSAAGQAMCPGACLKAKLLSSTNVTSACRLPMHQLRLLAVTEPVAELWTEPEPPEPAAARPQRGTGGPGPLLAQTGQGAQTPGSPSQSLWGRLRGALPGGTAQEVPEAGASRGDQHEQPRGPPVPRMVQSGHQADPAAIPAGTHAGGAQTPGSPSRSLWGRLRGALPGGTAHTVPQAKASERVCQAPVLDRTTEGIRGAGRHLEQQLQEPGWWAKMWARAAGRRKPRISRQSSTGAQQSGGELSGDLGSCRQWACRIRSEHVLRCTSAMQYRLGHVRSMDKTHVICCQSSLNMCYDVLLPCGTGLGMYVVWTRHM